MTDEKFTFIEDVREKKKTATGAHHKRTHCGKGGAIRFPSDFKTKKEREAMNGEVKSYKLNDPMSWEDFKVMPDDIKIAYIKALRKRYNVSDTQIAKMLGTCQVNFSSVCRRLGIQSARKSREAWDEDGWYAWVNGVPVEAKEEAVTLDDGTEMDAAPEKCDEEVLEQAETCDTRGDDVAAHHVFHFNAVDDSTVRIRKVVRPSIPGWGQMELEGTVEECAKTLEMLLQDSRVKLAVSWAVM